MNAILTLPSHTKPAASPRSSPTLTQSRIHAPYVSFAHFGWLFTALVLALGAELFVSTGISIALPDIAGTLSASPDETSWVMTLYFVGFTAALPLAPFLSDALGQRLYLGISMLAFMLSSAGCAFSNSLHMLLVMRVIEGAAGAAFLVRYVVTVRSRLTLRSRRIALFFLLIAFAFRAIAPITAGYLTELFSWRWVFLSSIPLVGLALIALCFSREAWPRHRHPFPDIFGLALLITGLVAFCIMVSRAQVDDWFGNRTVAALAVIAIVSLPLFLWHQHRESNCRPLITLRSLTHGGILPGLLFALLFGFALQGGLYLIPQFLRSVGHNDAIAAGKMFTIDSTATLIALLVVAAGLILYPSRKWLVLTGLLFFASMALLALRQTSQTDNDSLWLPLILRGTCLAAGLLPLPDLMFREVADADFDHLAEARSLYYTVRQLGGVMGVALMSYLLDARESLYTNRLSQHLTSLDNNAAVARATIGQGLAGHGLMPSQLASGANAILHRLLLREAAVLSFRDIFWILSIVGIAMCLAAMLFPKIKKQPALIPQAPHTVFERTPAVNATFSRSLNVDPAVAHTHAPSLHVEHSKPGAPTFTLSSPASPPPRDRISLNRVIVATSVVLTVLAILAVGTYYWMPEARGIETTDDAYVDGHVVYAAPQAAGRVSEVLVDDNAEVKPNQLLARIDASDYQAKLDQAHGLRSQAEGQLKQAIAQLEVTKAAAAQLRAQVRVAAANATHAAADLRRYKSLSEEAISKITLDAAETTVESTNAQHDAALQNVAAADAQVELARTSIATAEANVKSAIAAENLAALNVSYCELRAPMAGFVARKTVEAGNYVNVGQPLLILVPKNIYITANFKETQVTSMRVGQKVSLTVDTYPGTLFHGHIDSIMSGTGSAFALLPAENATGNFVKVVQRIPVKILLDTDNNDPSHRLAPGMSVVPSVSIKDTSSEISR